VNFVIVVIGGGREPGAAHQAVLDTLTFPAPACRAESGWIAKSR
jgi:hypothetical protein